MRQSGSKGVSNTASGLLRPRDTHCHPGASIPNHPSLTSTSVREWCSLTLPGAFLAPAVACPLPHCPPSACAWPFEELGSSSLLPLPSPRRGKMASRLAFLQAAMDSSV